MAKAEVGKLEMRPETVGGPDANGAIKGTRTVDYALEGKHEATIYDGDRLAPGMEFPGPAIVEDSGSTVVVHPGNSVLVDAFRNIHITLNG